MASRQDLKLMVRVARRYYKDGETQAEIAREMGISRPKVSRILQRARRMGIVEIRISDPFAQYSGLEQALIETFGLIDAAVASAAEDSPEMVRRRIGQRAAWYLESVLRDGDVVGIGWGRTLHAMVTSLQNSSTNRISVVPLIGGLGGIAPAFQVHELARMLAEAFGGTWQSFYTPAILDDAEAWRSLQRSDDVTRMVEAWGALDVALVGIGNVTSEPAVQMLFADYLDAETQRRLREMRAVGDVCVRFFDIHGKLCPDVFAGVAGIQPPQLRTVPRVIGVAGGHGKENALLGALRARLIDVLVTDEWAATRVLELAR